MTELREVEEGAGEEVIESTLLGLCRFNSLKKKVISHNLNFFHT